MELDRIAKDGGRRERYVRRLKMEGKDSTINKPLCSYQSVVGMWGERYKEIPR